MSDTPSQWFLYLVRNNQGALYTGITTNVARRFSEHQAGGLKAAKALKGKGPLILEFSTSLPNRAVASQLEYRIKKLTKAKKERLIKNSDLIEEWELLIP